MKKFFLKNLWCFIVLLISILFLFLSVFSLIFLVIGSLGISVVLLFYAVKSKNKYKKAKEFSAEEEYFDATKYDFDEDIYYVGSGTKKKEIKKQFLSKMGALTPTIFFFALAFAFISVAVMSIIKFIKI